MTQSLIPLKPKQRPITSLPRFATDLPFFYLTKQKELLDSDIDFQGIDEAGRPLLWKVSPNSKKHIGAPGIEAHEIWVKLIKPAVDEAREQNSGELPSVVPLGAVRECLRVLGWTIGGFQGRRLLKCIRQIVAATCDADFWLPTIERDEEGKPLFRHIKGTFSRMTLYAIGSAHVTEEELKIGKFSFDFDLEDTVYIQLHSLEVEMQRNQKQQPIDNEYLFSVSPKSRRWYELLQPKIFGVTNNRGPGYCEVRYSWYIERHHTLKRHTERYRVVYQMNELIKDHKAFGYVSKVEYLEVKEPGQEVDFIIRYWPGSGAKESTTRIRSRIGKKHWKQQELPLPVTEETRAPQVPASFPLELDRLVKKLLEHGMSFTEAERLVREDALQVTRQLEYFPHQPNVKHPERFLTEAIRRRYDPPPSYLTLQEREREQAETQALRACPFCHGTEAYIFRGSQRRCSHNPDEETTYRQTLEAQEVAAPTKFEFQKMVEEKRAEERQKRKG